MTVVLESDGTEVEDDAILDAVKGEVLLLLQEGECWTPRAVTLKVETGQPPLQEPAPVQPRTPSPAVASDHEPVSSGSIGTSSPVSGRRVTMGTPLPLFSSRVSRCLTEGQSKIVWSLLVNEAAGYYLENFPDIGSRQEYTAIGRKMLAQYPCIRTEGNEGWLTYTTCQKRALVREGELEAFTSLSEEEYIGHMEELKAEWEKPNPSEVHVKALLRETFTNNQAFIKGLPDGQVASVLEKLPCYRESTYVMADFKRLISERQYGRIVHTLPTFCAAVGKLGNLDLSENLEESLLSIIQFVEEQTRIDRGRGKKTESVIQVKEDVPDDEVEKELRCGKLAPPRLVIFKSEGCIKGQYVVADGTYINVNSCSEKAGVLLLVAVYYILDLEYPRVYSQLLGILQTHLVDIQPYTGIKSVRYRKFSTDLTKQMSEEAVIYYPE
ncbi:hypothetical protein ScPMuIL_006305 [Solemya velum]